MKRSEDISSAEGDNHGVIIENDIGRQKMASAKRSVMKENENNNGVAAKMTSIKSGELADVMTCGINQNGMAK